MGHMHSLLGNCTQIAYFLITQSLGTKFLVLGMNGFLREKNIMKHQAEAQDTQEYGNLTRQFLGLLDQYLKIKTVKKVEIQPDKPQGLRQR